MIFFGVMFIQDEKLYIGIKRGKKKNVFFFGTINRGKNKG